MGVADFLSGDVGKMLDGQFGKRLEAATSAVSGLAEVVKMDTDTKKELTKAVKSLDNGIKALLEELRKGK